MIQTRPYNDHQAMFVLRQLDPSDLIEAQLVRGQAVDHLSLFADWRAVQASRVVSLIVTLDSAHGGVPFAVLALAHTGQSGVAQAAFLSRDHQKFRRALAYAGLTIRRQMPVFCHDNGIHRVEARCWAGHPTAPGFLTNIGYKAETTMRGFGPHGRAEFIQFAWVSPETSTEG